MQRARTSLGIASHPAAVSFRRKPRGITAPDSGVGGCWARNSATRAASASVSRSSRTCRGPRRGRTRRAGSGPMTRPRAAPSSGHQARSSRRARTSTECRPQVFWNIAPSPPTPNTSSCPGAHDGAGTQRDASLCAARYYRFARERVRGFPMPVSAFLALHGRNRDALHHVHWGIEAWPARAAHRGECAVVGARTVR